MIEVNVEDLKALLQQAVRDQLSDIAMLPEPKRQKARDELIKTLAHGIYNTPRRSAGHASGRRADSIRPPQPVPGRCQGLD